MSDLIVQWPELESGILIRRCKRFLADIELSSGQTGHRALPKFREDAGVFSARKQGSPVEFLVYSTAITASGMSIGCPVPVSLS